MVAVLAQPITAEGTIAHLRTRGGVTPVTADRLRHADLILILATRVTEETLSWMQRAAAQSASGEARQESTLAAKMVKSCVITKGLGARCTARSS